jgi:DNA polymerase IV
MEPWTEEVKQRKIIHIDMDAFYASVEQRENPDLRGKPVIVGGPPHSRGVVAACSYEARKYSIHSAMPSSQAYRLCPKAVFLKPHFTLYKEISQQIREIFHRYTDLVEPLSLDEAYLDVTENFMNISSATIIAREIKKKILDETRLTASAGVSFNKFLAKVASDMNKPDGLTVIIPGDAEAFIERLPVGKFFGIGKVTEKHLKKMGILTGKDLKDLDISEMVNIFGKSGSFFYNIVRGIDKRPVNPHWIRKSLGKEVTLQEDIITVEDALEILARIASQVHLLLEKNRIRARTLTLKIKYYDFKSITRSITLDEQISSVEIIMMHVKRLLESTEAGKKKIRLLGISTSNFLHGEEEEKNSSQLILPFGER